MLSARNQKNASVHKVGKLILTK